MKTASWLLGLFRPALGWLVLGWFLALLTLLANVVLMATSGWFIAAMGLAGVAGITMNYFTPAAIIRACAIARTTGRYGERLVTHDATLRVLSRLRAAFYRRLETLAPAGLEGERSGDLLGRLGADIDTLDNLYLRILLPLAVAVPAALLFTGWLWWQWPPLALAEGGLLLVAGFLLPAWMARRGHRHGAGETELAHRLRTEAVEGLQGLGELILHGADSRFAGELERIDHRLGEARLRAARWRNAGQATVETGAWLALWALLVLLAPQVHQGLRPPAELALFALFALASFEAVMPLPATFHALRPTATAARHLHALAHRPPPLPEPPGPPPQPAHHGFRFRSVGFRHAGAEEPVLEGIDLELPEGSHTAIIGPTGAGKSTLLQLMVRFRLPSSGTLDFGGISMVDWPGEALRRHLSVVEQQGHLFIGTLRDNLLLARPDADEARLRDACRKAGLGPWLEALPEGLETEIGEAALRISGGEARRLAIARALLRETPVLLLDEPTEGLDRPTARQVMENLLEHCRNRTLVLVTHRLDLLPRMDQVVLLDRGRILARGTHQSLLDTAPAYRHLLELAPRLG